MGKAKGFLFPLQWDEPFGMVVIEAMAAGTPVLAYRRGSMPELIKHGETGYLLDIEDEMVEMTRSNRDAGSRALPGVGRGTFLCGADGRWL